MVVILFSAEMMIYYYVWTRYYSDYMEITYARLGHRMMVAVYAGSK